MVDIVIDKKERQLLQYAHPYGCTSRCLITIGHAKPGEIGSLIKRELLEETRKGVYGLTHHGRAALGKAATK